MQKSCPKFAKVIKFSDQIISKQSMKLKQKSCQIYRKSDQNVAKIVPKGYLNGPRAPQWPQKILENHKVPKKSESLRRNHPFFKEFFFLGGFLGPPRGTPNREKIEKMGAKSRFFQR